MLEDRHKRIKINDASTVEIFVADASDIDGGKLPLLKPQDLLACYCTNKVTVQHSIDRRVVLS